jgi:hypothetical protein
MASIERLIRQLEDRRAFVLQPLSAPTTNHAGRVDRPRFGGMVCEWASAPSAIALVAKSWGLCASARRRGTYRCR